MFWRGVLILIAIAAAIFLCAMVVWLAWAGLHLKYPDDLGADDTLVWIAIYGAPIWALLFAKICFSVWDATRLLTRWISKPRAPKIKIGQ
jgi:hypothetical protein